VTLELDRFTADELAAVPAAADLLRVWDALRPRSQQKDLGMSALGGCRRAAGYVINGYEGEPNDYSLTAIIGTMVHDGLARAARATIPGALAEDIEVRFGGIVGHPDLYVSRTVVDYKTRARASDLDRVSTFGPPKRERWQAHTYGAAMILAGYPVERIRIEYISRESGETWLWEEPFDIELVREAMAWLNQVRETPLEYLSRDYRPTSVFCGGCEFFKLCWEGHAIPDRDPRSAFFADEPDAAVWVKRLEVAKKARDAAERDYQDAKGALDALRPGGQPGGHYDVDCGLGDGRVVRFTVAHGRESYDKETITADYARAGARPPAIRGAPVVRISIVKPRAQTSGRRRGKGGVPDDTV
jgi:hypothetical protein